MSNTLFYTKLWIKSRLSRWFTRYVGDSARALLTNANGLRLLIPISDLSMARSLSRRGGYGKPLRDLLLSMVDEKSRVLFVGCHIGSLLIPVAKKCGSITGIEANPNTLELLRMNLTLNNVTNTTLLHLAAYDKEATVPFLASRDNTGGSKIESGDTSSFEFQYDQPERILVPANRLDAVLADKKFDLIVMDVEGAEYGALSGMTEILRDSAALVLEILPNAIEKLSGKSGADIFNLLPPHLRRARPVETPDLAADYPRERFDDLYRDIDRTRRMSGADVLFSA
jgi:FkbM family methyltransferase